MRRYPFDKHRLEAVFEVLGFDRDEVVMEVDSAYVNSLMPGKVRIPQWSITGSGMEIRDRSASYSGHQGVVSAFIVSADVERNSFHAIRLVVFPLIVIVLLSFGVLDGSVVARRPNQCLVHRNPDQRRLPFDNK